MQLPKIDLLGSLILGLLFTLLAYGGYISYKSIDWDVLKRLEASPLLLPTPIITNPATPSASTSPSATLKP